MPKVLGLRPRTGEEPRTVERLAHPRPAPARAVERARVVRHARRGARVPALARPRGPCGATVRLRLTRVNAHRPDGVADAPRAGRPPTSTPAAGGEVIAAGPTGPAALGRPFGSWPPDRSTADLHETEDPAIGRGRIGGLPTAAGLRWREQATRSGARGDPGSAEKRGRSSRSAEHRRRLAS